MNVLNKQSKTDDKGWSSSLGVGPGANNNSPQKLILLRTVYIANCILKLKFSRYRPGVAQRVGRGIALLYHDRGTRRGRVVSSTPRPHFTHGKDPVPIVQEAGWAPGSKLYTTVLKRIPHICILFQYLITAAIFFPVSQLYRPCVL